MYKVILNAESDFKLLCWTDDEYKATMIVAALRNIDTTNTFTILEEHGTRKNGFGDAQDPTGDWEWTAFV